MGLPFSRLPTGDDNLDRVQQNIADLAARIPASSAPTVVTVTSNYTVAGNEDVIHVDASSGPVRIALPTPAVGQRPLTIKQTNLPGASGAKPNAVTVVAANGAPVLAGAALVALDASGSGSVTLTSDGRQYWPTATAGGAASGTAAALQPLAPKPAAGSITAQLPITGGGSTAAQTSIGLAYEAPLSADSGPLTVDVFGASGAGHAIGAVPDPGSSAGTTRYLREDATFAVPPVGTDDHKVAATSSDGSPDYLVNKLVPLDASIDVATAAGGTLVTVGVHEPWRVLASGSDTSPDVLANKLVSQGGTVELSTTAGGSLVNAELSGSLPVAMYVYNYGGWAPRNSGITNVPLASGGLGNGTTETLGDGWAPTAVTSGGFDHFEYAPRVVARGVRVVANLIDNSLTPSGSDVVTWNVTRSGGTIVASISAVYGAGAEVIDSGVVPIDTPLDTDTWGLTVTTTPDSIGGGIQGTVQIMLYATYNASSDFPSDGIYCHYVWSTPPANDGTNVTGPWPDQGISGVDIAPSGSPLWDSTTASRPGMRATAGPDAYMQSSGYSLTPSAGYSVLQVVTLDAAPPGNEITYGTDIGYGYIGAETTAENYLWVGDGATLASPVAPAAYTFLLITFDNSSNVVTVYDPSDLTTASGSHAGWPGTGGGSVSSLFIGAGGFPVDPAVSIVVHEFAIWDHVLTLSEREQLQSCLTSNY